MQYSNGGRGARTGRSIAAGKGVNAARPEVGVAHYGFRKNSDKIEIGIASSFTTPSPVGLKIVPRMCSKESSLMPDFFMSARYETIIV